jgi:hypothetical protein
MKASTATADTPLSIHCSGIAMGPVEKGGWEFFLSCSRSSESCSLKQFVNKRLKRLPLLAGHLPQLIQETWLKPNGDELFRDGTRTDGKWHIADGVHETTDCATGETGRHPRHESRLSR